jgi:hypothetical protein
MCWEPLSSIPRVPDLRAFYAALGDRPEPARLNGNDPEVFSLITIAVLLGRRKGHR